VTPGATGGPCSGPSPARSGAGAYLDTESRWRSLFENASAGVVLLDPVGHFLSANATYQSMVGYSEEELRKLTPVDIAHEDDRALTESHLARLTHAHPRRPWWSASTRLKARRDVEGGCRDGHLGARPRHGASRR
jgi:PAS domain S-box-containing protein